MKQWVVYIIRCSDNTLYTGISNDVERRMVQHATAKGAKYFRGRTPEQLVFVETGHDRSSASRREALIKRLSRTDKDRLINSAANNVREVALQTDLRRLGQIETEEA